MEQEQLDNLKKWFETYVAGFYGDDVAVNDNIELKEVHSKAVCDETAWLADRLGLSDNQKRIAQAIGLLHDVGRFKQFKEYRTYKDASSVNHSALGAQIMQYKGILSGFDETEIKWIVMAVKHHGDKKLPEDLDSETLLYCQLIRDADKIDIYRVVIEYYTKYLENPAGFNLDLEVPDEPWYSQEFVEHLLKGERIGYEQMKTFNDIKLLMLSWVYDVNFTPTLERIKQRGFLEKVIDFLPANEDIEQVRRKVLEYVDSRIKQNTD
jgi:hypothetical protein